MTYDAYEISSVQKRMYLIHRMQGSNTVYNMPFAWIIEGPVEREKLEKSIRELIRIHESLRTLFVSDKDGDISQLVVHELDFKLKYTHTECQSEKDIDTLLEAFVRPFDLAAVPLWRMELVRLEPGKHVLLFDIHHIVFDGASMDVFMNDLMTLYGGGEVPEPECQYVDFTMWHNDLLEGEEIEKQEAYWLDRLSGELPRLDLTTDFQRTLEPGEEGDTVHFQMGRELSEKLYKMAGLENLTLYTLLLAGLYILLYRYTRQDDIIVGSVIHGRSQEDFENIIGMFVNTLALREQPEAEKTFRDFLRDVYRNTLAAFDNQDYPFDMLVEKVSPQRELNRNPLFDVIFVLQNIDYNVPVSPGGEGGLTIRRHHYANPVARFDLVMLAHEGEQGISLEMEYRRSLFRRETVERMGGHYINLLHAVAENPGLKLWQIPLMSVEEKERVITGFNSTGHAIPGTETIHGLFSRQAARNPEKIALVLPSQTMTYGELDGKSDNLAHYLIEKGAGPGMITGIMVEPSVEMAVGIMGILKSGAAYLPIDPGYPQDRIDYMKSDSNASIILTGDDIVESQTAPAPGGVAPAGQLNPVTDICYVIYTSGTTGRPKGVMVEHRQAVNTLSHRREIYGMTCDDVSLQLFSFAFDGFVTSFFTPLLSGSRVVMPGRETILDGSGLSRLIRDEGVTHFICVPSLLNTLLDAFSGSDLDSLKAITLAGETIIPALLEKIKKTLPHTEIINEYGVTEAAVMSTLFRNQEKSPEITIGSPVANTQLYILDPRQQAQPVGVPGELYIGGSGVARGYMNKPELTAERFLHSKFIIQNSKLYKSGDLCRWLPGGNIEYLGRIDEQVKIRGFRIEPGEIENRIIEHPDIKNAVVPVLETPTGEKYLCAYIVVRTGLKPVPMDIGTRIKDFLSQSLPEYMVPSYIILLEKIPLTANGKVDRRALPAPEIGAGDSYVAPSGEIENKMAALWSEILEIPAESISVTANFFDLGGHSLKATLLTARIHQVFDVKIALTDIFAYHSIRELARLVEQTGETIYDAISMVEEQDYYPLSSAQKRLFFIQQFQDTGTGYNMPTALRVIGEPDIERLETAFRELIQRHESLRTSFHTIDGEYYQRVHKNVSFSFESDLPVYDPGNPSGLFGAFIRPFDLTRPPLLRVGLAPVGENEHLLLFDMHHIITDGSSLGVLVDETIALYDGREPDVMPVQYKDFAVWQNRLFEAGQIREQETYWLELFGGGDIPRLNLPTDYPRPEVFRFQGDRYPFELADAPGFIRMARQNNATLHMNLMAAFNVLLHRYSGQEDIVVGSGIAGRPHADLQKVIGMFVNTLAIRSYPVSGKSYRDFLQDVKQTNLKALENQDIQFEELVNRLNLERDRSHNPLFDVVLVVQNFRLPEIVIQDLVFKSYELENRTAKFDITLMAFEAEDRVSMVLEYRTDLFTRRTIGRMAEHLNRIVRQVIDNPDISISDISLLNEAETHRLLYEFNDTQTPYPSDKTIHELFRDQVERTPDRVAVIDGMHTHMTYRELDLLSGDTAAYLAETGVEPGGIVALETGRSVEMLTGLIGILKAGCAYLPIDPSQPEDRQQYMLTDANAATILKTKKTPSQLTKSRETARRVVGNAGDMAYIIYTSGSTGRPKGVMVEHRNVVRLVKDTNYVDFNIPGRILQTGALDFDASTFEVWGALLNGWTLHLESKENIINPGALREIIQRANITAIWMTAPLFNQVCDTDIHVFAPLQYLLVGGDVLSPPHINRLRERYPHIKIINGYGPTENTTFSTTLHIDKEYTHNIPIGKPIANSTAYILDRNGNPVPIGVPGELVVGGDGVSRGYLNNPELTQEKFIDSKLYKTGDLARWLPDGNIEFLGRIDQQVKIRGFRIEPGEIETRIMESPDVKDVVVPVLETTTGEKYLCAYIVPAEIPGTGSPGIINPLKEYLSASLPDFMIPSHFVVLDKIPLTPNGKVDRRSLPAPEIGTGGDYTPPSGEIETRLADIWAEILEISTDSISVTANFFDLGGHSLKATLLTARIHKAFDVKIALADIFVHATVRELAQLVEQSVKTSFVSIEPVEERAFYPVSSAQKRLFILQQLDKDGLFYNMPMVIPLDPSIDVSRIEEIFSILIQRHESFRTSFHIIDGGPVQKIHPQVTFRFETVIRVKAFIRSFDLSQAPLLRAGLMDGPGERPLLLVDMHHIISDGVSHSILQKEFMALLENQALPSMKLSYKDYSVWQQQQESTGGLKPQEQYWLERFAGEIPVLELPYDYPRPATQSFEGSIWRFRLDAVETAKLERFVQQQGGTLFMTLLSAFYVLLWKLSGQEDIVTGIPVAGRSNADMEKIIGMFVNTLALRIRIDGDSTYGDFFDSVKQDTLAAFENQDYPFDELVQQVSHTRDAGRNPLFDVMFALGEAGGQTTAPENTNQLEIGISKFDMTLNARELGDTLEMTLEYCTGLFKEESIQRFADYYISIITQITSDADIPLSQIDILPASERQRVLVDFNRTQVDFPHDKTLHELFAEQVSRTPDAAAVIESGGRRISYRQLDHDAGALASSLVEKGVKPGNIIGLNLERSIEMMVGVLGILKSGCAYLPISPEYPRERIDYMLSDSNASLLLTIDDIVQSQPATGGAAPQPVTDICYVIYTSGTTGKPKGVMIQHHSAVNIVSWFARTYHVKPGDNILQMSDFTFDASVNQFFGTLLHGATLHIVSRDQLMDIHYLRDYIRRNRINILNFVPQHLHALLGEGPKLDSVRAVLSGAERLDENIKDHLIRKGYKLYNQYGPTETTIDALTGHCRPGTPVNLGTPVHNARVYILDKFHNPVPAGVAGELFVSGAGVAQGYLNRPHLTMEKFIPNPFKNPGDPAYYDHMYCTGDRVRWLPDGNVQFLGRADAQVKIRGFRIELGEIENHLLKHPRIKDALVLVKERSGSEKYLCAYIIPQDDAPEESQLNEFLGKTLPDYMIPSHFISLDVFPLTPGGKVDRRELPEPDGMPGGTVYTAPRNRTESEMVTLWADVLGIDKENLGIDHNFFRLGGHSLKATLLIARIHKTLDTRIPLPQLFSNPTVRELSRYIADSQRQEFLAVQPAEKKDYYALSSAQTRLFILHQMEPEGTVYNMPSAIPLQDDTDTRLLEDTFKRLIARHESLRTGFQVIAGQPVQRIHQHVDFTLQYDPYDQSDQYDLYDLYKSFVKPFDLARPPLLRVALATRGDGSKLLLIDMHHIISDGMSQKILNREFESLHSGRELPPLPLQYKDFAQWQQKPEVQAAMEKQEEWWISRFRDGVPVLELPIDFQRPPVQSFEGNAVHLPINPTQTERLKELAARQGATLFMLLLGVFKVLLARLSGQDDIVVGTPVAGRGHADLENIIGMFVNTLSLKSHVPGDITFEAFLEQLKHFTLEAFENQDYPFEELVEKVVEKRDAGRNPIFDIVFTLSEGELKDTDYGSGVAKFDLTLYALETPREIELVFVYCTRLFKEETIKRFSTHFHNILSAVLDNPQTRLSQIYILSPEEKQQVCIDFNRHDTQYPVDMTLPRLFSLAVEKYPRNIAVVDRDMRELTFKELDDRSNLLAANLIGKGIGENSLVGLSVERSAEMIAGILGILKTGAGYVPLNPKAPESRNRYILEDAGVSLVLTGQDIERLSTPDGVEPVPVPFDAPVIDPSGCAYVIYTSGTTGQPKGVPISHSNLMPLLHWGYDKLGISPQDRALQNLSYYFDWSVWEIFFVLTSGARLYMISDEILLNPDAGIDFILENQISVLHVTPTQYSYFLKAGRKLETLRYLFIGAEKLAHDIVRRSFQSVNPECRVFNMYGPTEATIISATLEIEPDFQEKYKHLSSLPIGYAAGNSAHYILDNHMNPVPVNVVGQLYIAGDGLSKGYLNNPELTAQKFIPPNSKFIIQNSKLYKTGDMARWVEDGTIEFLGRADQQVKIRGFRIELGEIESRLLQHPEIKEAVVLAPEDENGENYLCAYVVGTGPEPVPAADINLHLKEFLSQSLPAYMIPAHFIPLEKIPLTPNGKLDYRALPRPDQEGTDDFKAPIDETEIQLAGIWSHVLRIPVEKIGVDSDFFQLGGHSLKATFVKANIHKETGIKIPLPELFQHTTLQSLAQYIKTRKSGDYRSRDPLRPAQERLPVDTEPLSLPIDFPREQARHFQSSRSGFQVNGPEIAPHRQLAAESGCELHVLFLAVFKILLSRLGSSEDICVATALHGPAEPGTQQLSGLLDNTLVIRTQPRKDIPFDRFLEEVRTAVSGSGENSGYPIGEWLKNNPGHPVNVLYNSSPDNSSPDKSSPASPEQPREIPYDLVFTLSEEEEGVTCYFDYRTALFESQTIQRYIDYFTRILRQVGEAPQTPLQDISVAEELTQTQSSVSGELGDDFEF